MTIELGQMALDAGQGAPAAPPSRQRPVMISEMAPIYDMYDGPAMAELARSARMLLAAASTRLAVWWGLAAERHPQGHHLAEHVGR
jgi:hypothetical protein